MVGETSMRPSGRRDKLVALAGKRIGDYAIHVSELEPTRLLGAWRFTLRLKDRGGRLSSPLVQGRYFEGRGRWIRPWLEVDYRPLTDFCGSKVSITEGLDVELFNALAGILPPGGSIMVKYGEHFDTARALALNVPPPATPLGYLLWRSGSRWFKDWYFPEGWLEGDQKLQGNKPFDVKHRKLREKETAAELRKFIKNKFSLEDSLLDRCRELARKILNSIDER